MITDNSDASDEQFVVDAEGARVGVIVTIERYQQLLQAIEELESIREYDAAKAADDESVPFEQAVRETEQER